MAEISEILGEIWRVEGRRKSTRGAQQCREVRASPDRFCQVTHGVSAAEPQGIASLRPTPEGRRQRRSSAGNQTIFSRHARGVPVPHVQTRGPRRCTGIFRQSTTSWSRRGRTRQSFDCWVPGKERVPRASKLQGSRKSLDGGWSRWASAGEQAPPEQSSAGATSNNVTRPANHISEDHMAHFGCEGLRVQAGGLCPAFCNLSVPRHQ